MGKKPQRNAIGRNFGSNWIFLRKWAKTTTLRDWPNFGKNWIFGTVWARPESSGKWLSVKFSLVESLNP